MKAKTTAIERLVQEFAINVMTQTDALWERNDARTSNKHAMRVFKAFDKLREIGDVGRDALVPLMYEGRADVRSAAAVFLLRYKHKEARQVLEELGRGESLVAFGAQEALKRWAEGTWELDPEDEQPPAS